MDHPQSIRVVLIAILTVAAHGTLADAAPEHSMTGCLAAAAGAFRLTDLGLPDGPAAVEIASTSVDLTPHIGHKIEITGSTVSGADTAAHTMKVTAMKHLAAACP